MAVENDSSGPRLDIQHRTKGRNQEGQETAREKRQDKGCQHQKHELRRKRLRRGRDRDKERHTDTQSQTESRGRLTAKRREERKFVCQMKGRESRKTGQGKASMVGKIRGQKK